MVRWLAILILIAGLAAAALFVAAGRGAPPAISIEQPGPLVGRKGTLEVAVEAPGGVLSQLTIAVEQNGQTLPLFSLDSQDAGAVVAAGENRVRVTRPFGKEAVPDLQAGPARIVVSAERPSLLNLRTIPASTAKDIEVRLDPPRVTVLSTYHYINHGGSEMVVYQASPADVASGVRVGDLEYPGYPAAGAGVTGAPDALRVAFFALTHDQDVTTPIAVFARDAAGNETTVPFVDQVFPKKFRRSRITIDDRFLGRVVPEILERSPELKRPSGGDLLEAFLAINGELRRQNAETIARITAATRPERLWTGPFVQLGRSKVEAGFADYRTYFAGGKEVDRQVHLGYDLAVTAAVPIAAANDGVVLHAAWLGIYGNCVIVDHGMGVASLYGHLSSVDVKQGDAVTKGQIIGRSGMTGLAGGDHLHFTMLVHGRPVNPVEWWDPQWIRDRIERKLTAAADAAAAP